MQRLTAKVSIGAVLLVTAGAAFLAGSVIKDGNAQEVQQMQDRTLGIEWVNFTTGVDHNQHARDAAGTTKQYFAEIHLLILLDHATWVKVDKAAEDKDLTELKRLLTGMLDHNWPGFVADSTLIAALMLRP